MNRIFQTLLSALLCWSAGAFAQQEIYVQHQASAALETGVIKAALSLQAGQAAFTTSGKELVVLDVRSLKPVFSYPQLPNILASLTLLGDGMLVTARIDGQLNYWDPKGGAMLKSLTAHTAGISDFAITKPSMVVLTTLDNQLKLFNPAEGEDLSVVDPSPEVISSMALHPDGQTLAVGYRSGKVVIYDSSLAPTATLTDLRELPAVVAFSPDGRFLASGGIDGTVRFWECSGWIFRGSKTAQRGAVTSLAFDPSYRWIASTAVDSTLLVFDLATMGVVKTLRKDSSAFTAVFFPAERSMLTGSSNGAVDLWTVLERPPDTTAPTLTILRPARYTEGAPSLVYAKEYEVFGLVYDENEVTEVAIGGIKATLTDPKVENASAEQAGLHGKEFSAKIPLSTAGLNRIEVRAVDGSSNGSTQVLFIKRLSAAEAVEIVAPVENSETDLVAVEIEVKPWFEVGSYTLSANTVDVVERRGPLRIKPGDVIREEVPLIVGYNQISVSLVSKQGERFTKLIGVNRRFSAAMAETIRQPGSAGRSTGPQRWAVIVGVSEYGNKGIPALSYADRDAEALAAFLQTPEGGGFDRDHMRILVNQDATLSNLREAMIDFLQQAIDKDLVVIYFAGHGAPDPTRPQNLYLLTYDTDPNRLGTTAFPMWDIQTVIARQVAAKKVVVFSDACHSGGISVDVATRGLDVTQSNPINQYLAELARAKDGLVVFTASAAGEVSQEFPELGHGVFTYYLLEGLKGAADLNNDYLVTVNELMGFVEEQVKRKTRGAQNPTRSQTSYDKELPMSVLNK
ncbi:MAG TPA: caspase family protein [Bacteroidota bacterium]